MSFDLGQPVRIIATGEIATVFGRIEWGSPNLRYRVRVWRDGGSQDLELTPGELEAA